MAFDDYRPRKHSNAEMSLHLSRNEAMCLDTELPWLSNRTARVEVTLTFEDDNGTTYTASRIIKMRLRKE